MKGLKKVSWCAAVLVLFFVPFAVALAQTKLANPIAYNDLESFLLAIVKVVVQYGAILVVFFLVYAGFLFVTAQGSEEKIVQAKKTFVWVVIGAFVLLGVYVIRAAVCGTLNQLRAPDTPEFCQSPGNNTPGAGVITNKNPAAGVVPSNVPVAE